MSTTKTNYRGEADFTGPHGIKTTLTARELSGIVPLHPVTILRWAREGRIPHRRLSARKIVFLPSEINEWLASGSSLYSEPATRAA
jgi:predicted DNA-binding transcriptional regulator AlpA